MDVVNIVEVKHVLLCNLFQLNILFLEAKVERLQLNREGVVNLRRVLYAIGEHPPAEVK
jgi:hypothetical protein